MARGADWYDILHPAFQDCDNPLPRKAQTLLRVPEFPKVNTPLDTASRTRPPPHSLARLRVTQPHSHEVCMGTSFLLPCRQPCPCILFEASQQPEQPAASWAPALL